MNYLRYNAKLALPGMRGTNIPQPVQAPAIPTAGVSERAVGSDSGPWRELLPAAEFMVGRLCAQHPGTPIIFVAHSSDRYLPVEDVAEIPLLPDGTAVKMAIQGRVQCSFIDLRYAFSRDWATHHIRFESADGAHWNAYGNRLVAATLADFIASHGLIDDAVLQQ